MKKSLWIYHLTSVTGTLLKLYACLLLLVFAAGGSYGQAECDLEDITSPVGSGHGICDNSIDHFQNAPLPFHSVPAKVVNLMLHIVRDGDGEQNFKNNTAGLDRIYAIVDAINIRFGHLEMQEPLGICTPPSVHIVDSKIQFVISSIEFYDSEQYYCTDTRADHQELFAHFVTNNTALTQVEKTNNLHAIIVAFRGGGPNRDDCDNPVRVLGGTGIRGSDYCALRGYYDEPNIDLIAGHMAHELGHVLSLWHSWEDGNEGECDTGGGQNQSNNIMDYTSYLNNAFTQRQIAKMHYWIENHEGDPQPYLNNDLCLKQPGLITIEANENVHWTSNEIVSEDVHVHGILEITCTVEVANNVGIIVHENGKLIVDGGTITSRCDIWQGVKVAGEANWWFGSTAPGEVEIKNGAVIENAVIAIDGTDRYENSALGFDIEYGGGIITVENSTIQNCGTGVKLAPFGWGSYVGYGPTDEQSSIASSQITECQFGIYSDRNLGLELNNNIFEGNTIDYEGHGSAIEANDNTFSSYVTMYAEYPLAPGSKFLGNDFVESLLSTESQGNFTPMEVSLNSFYGWGAGMQYLGELHFKANNNSFYDAGLGFVTYVTGENTRNFVLNNAFYRNSYAAYAYGENDVEYLINCFEDTYQADIELYHGTSIHNQQGNQTHAAGNCFEDGARIITGTGTQPFTYWTKDGYFSGNPPPLPTCKYPGSGNFGIQLAQIESDDSGCGAGEQVTNLPPGYEDCQCESGDDGCKDAIAHLQDEITSVENDPNINPQVKEWLIAKYRRCIDDLMRRQVAAALSRGEIEPTITYLSLQPEFRYRIMAYGIMNHNLEYGRAEDYLVNLTISNSAEQEFVTAQLIYLDYIRDIENYVLSAPDSNTLRAIGSAENPYAGYTRSVYYLLTGVRIPVYLPHLDGSVTPRNSSESEQGRNGSLPEVIEVFPNPIEQSAVQLIIKNFDPEKFYKVTMLDSFGKIISSGIVAAEISSLSLGDIPGIYIIRVEKGEERVGIKRVIRL
ncbi:MAG TPA: zinc-dependent metalloprotease [Saprospiraceae bacterium]|nr:zinc-dependent metalloprotease [Saprospiraceae bacterium]